MSRATEVNEALLGAIWTPYRNHSIITQKEVAFLKGKLNQLGFQEVRHFLCDQRLPDCTFWISETMNNETVRSLMLEYDFEVNELTGLK